MRKLFALTACTVFLSACGDDGLTFTEPDIKDEFCGVHINFQYCKCAFHNDYCDAVAMTKDTANAHVQEQYVAHVERLRLSFKRECERMGGAMSGDTCTGVEDGS